MSYRQSLAVIALVVLATVGTGVVAGADSSDPDQPTATISVESEQVLAGDATRVDVTVTAPNRTDGIQRLVVRLGNASVASIDDAKARLPGTTEVRAIGGTRATLAWSAADVALEDGRVVLSLLVRGTAPGETTVEVATATGVERPGDGFYAIERRNGSVTVRDRDTEPPARLDGFELTDVTRNLTVGETARLPIRATASHGFGAATVAVSVPASVRYHNLTAPSQMTDVSTDGQAVRLSAIGYGADGPDVRLGTLTVTAVEPGTTEIGVTVETASTVNGTVYDLSGAAGNASLTITVASEPEAPAPAALGARDARATDPDGDGRYEDVDGNGVVSVIDVSTFLHGYETAPVAASPACFDFNGDGAISVVDVATLFTEVTSDS